MYLKRALYFLKKIQVENQVYQLFHTIFFCHLWATCGRGGGGLGVWSNVSHLEFVADQGKYSGPTPSFPFGNSVSSAVKSEGTTR